MLARMVLPKEVFDHFIIVKIEYVDIKIYISRSAMRTEILRKNCWHGADICSSSRQTSGRTGRKKEPKFFLNCIATCRRHTRSAIHWGWSLPETPSRMQQDSQWQSDTIRSTRLLFILSTSLRLLSTSIMMTFLTSTIIDHQTLLRNLSMQRSRLLELH